MTYSELVRELARRGWKLIRVGKHRTYGKNGVTVSVHFRGSKDVPKGTLAQIKKDTGENL